jgi:hypothetical protein
MVCRAVLAGVLSLILVAVAAPTSYAQAPPCGGPKQPPCPPPPVKSLCHNIGGPRDLGANCDMTGTCTAFTIAGDPIVLGPNQFLGIIISFNQDSLGAVAAHVNHGDGPIDVVYDPPLHLASVTGPHLDSNVECKGTRIIPQPTEPGN